MRNTKSSHAKEEYRLKYKRLGLLKFERSYKLVTISVSLKTTRGFENILGSFIYRKLSSLLFTGYEIKDFASNTYLIASKAKALFDYVYFLIDEVDWLRNKNYNVIEEKRLKVDLLNKNDWKELKRYLKLIKNGKTEIIKLQLEPYASSL